jgi:hypothetical protein
VDYLAIKIFHYVGIMLLFLGLGGMVFASSAGFGPEKKKLRRMAAILHGIGLLLIVVSGFTMLSKLNLMHGDPPGWAKAKFVIFLIMGFSISVAARWSRGIWFLIAGWILLGAAAAYLALYKPF